MTRLLDTKEKRPTDVLDYETEWDRWLIAGDVIALAVAVIDPQDVVSFVIDSVDFSDSQVRVWISGGEIGDSGSVAVTATTQGGRTRTEKFRLRIAD